MNVPYHRGNKLAQSYQLLRNMLQNHRDPETTWCLAMTATPGETRLHVYELLRCVATSTVLKTENYGVDDIRGLVSYAQLYGDYSHFAKLVPQMQCFPLEASYRTAYNMSLCKLSEFFANNPDKCGSNKPNASLDNEFNYIPEQKQLFYKFLRARSNYVMVKIGKGEADKGGAGRDRRECTKGICYRDAPKQLDSDSLEDDFAIEDTEGVNYMNHTIIKTKDGNGSYHIHVSPKLQGVVDNLVNLPPGKHYVYSSDKFTIGLVARMLKDRGFVWKSKPDTSSGRPGFILLNNIVSTKSHMDGLMYQHGYRMLSGAELVKKIDACKRMANMDENAHGDVVRVILATGENFKGVDINHIKYLHLVDAMTDYQDFVQFVGRGARYCGHRLWQDVADRKVQVFMYHLTPPANVSDTRYYADPELWTLSRSRYSTEWDSLETILQEASVDYYVFKDNLHANTHAIKKSLQSAVCKRKVKDDKPRYIVDKERMRMLRERQKLRIAKARAVEP